VAHVLLPGRPMDFALQTPMMVTALRMEREDSVEGAHPPGTAVLARPTTLVPALPALMPLLLAHALLLGAGLPPVAVVVVHRLGIPLGPKATTPRPLVATITRRPRLVPTPALPHLARRPLHRAGQRVRPLPVH
jgi:hypothetical protein